METGEKKFSEETERSGEIRPEDGGKAGDPVLEKAAGGTGKADPRPDMSKEEAAPGMDYHDEMIQIEMLFQSHIVSFGYKEYSLETYVDRHVFGAWKAREGCADTDEMRAGLNIDGILRSADPSESEVLTYLQYTLNIAELCRRAFNQEKAPGYDFDIRNYTELLSRIRAILRRLGYEVKYIPEKEFIYIVPRDAAAEAVSADETDPVSQAVTEYRSTSFAGNLAGKRKILAELGKTIESYPDNLKSEHAVLFSRIEFMLNHVQIRHDQSEGDDRIERVALMSADELEHWYDETYRLILLRILEHQSEDRIRDIDELAGECGIGIETISEEEMADLLNGRLPEEESADGSPSPEEDAEKKPEGKEKDSGADGHLPESGEAREKKPAEVRSGSSGSAKRIIIAVLVADILFVLFVLCWILFVGV